MKGVPEMNGETYRLRYLLPKMSKSNYALWMKTYHNCLTFDTSDVAKFRLHVLDHYYLYGWRAACNAFKVGKSTIFDWKKIFEKSGKRLFSLVPKSTRPKRFRQMSVDYRLIELIKAIREKYGAVSKYKLKCFIDAYACELGIKSLGYSAIGKIIKRRHFFFEANQKIRKKSRLTNYLRIKKSPKETKPGYLEMDSVTLWVAGVKHYFITIIDIFSKLAWCKRVNSLSARQATETLQEFQSHYPDYPIETIQTDNGSEFLGEFHQYLEEKQIIHQFIYPRSPRINGVVERFNRTIQDEFLTRSDELFDNSPGFYQKLKNYLLWYNGQRPHAALNYQTPLAFLQTKFSGMWAS